MIEIHGKHECPYSWRVRLCAREKDLPFRWVPSEAPRASPLLRDDEFELTESDVIVQYLDEAHPGTPLQPLSARDRAQMLLRIKTLGSLEKGFAPLEEALADGREYLGGNKPDLSDVCVWPFLAQANARLPPRTQQYWNRVRERESLRATRPTDS